MSRLRLFYLILATIGAIAPVVFDAGWGFGQGVLLDSWNLSLALLALVVFAGVEARARKDYWPLAALPVAMFISLAAGLPLYLFLRSRVMD